VLQAGGPPCDHNSAEDFEEEAGAVGPTEPSPWLSLKATAFTRGSRFTWHPIRLVPTKSILSFRSFALANCWFLRGLQRALGSHVADVHDASLPPTY
jgi:hypothetical protein